MSFGVHTCLAWMWVNDSRIYSRSATPIPACPAGVTEARVSRFEISFNLCVNLYLSLMHIHRERRKVIKPALISLQSFIKISIDENVNRDAFTLLDRMHFKDQYNLAAGARLW